MVILLSIKKEGGETASMAHSKVNLILPTHLKLAGSHAVSCLLKLYINRKVKKGELHAGTIPVFMLS